MMNKKISAYSIVSQSRGFLMGIAIIWVVIYHAKFEIHSDTMTFLRHLGFGGVDMFLFISGFGVAHSLAKNSPSVFFKNRLRKILPATYLYLLAYGIYKFVTSTEFTFQEIVGWFTLTGYWAGLSRQANWYIYTSMLLYALSPLLYSLLKESKRPKLTLGVLIGFAYLASVSFWETDTLMAVSRVPLYLLGFYAGMYWDREKPMTGKHWALTIGAGLVGLGFIRYSLFHMDYDWLRNYGFFWYPFVLYAPAFVLAAGWVYCQIKDKKILRPLIGAVQACGSASLEILVVHIFVFSIAKTFSWIPADSSVYNLLWMLLCAATVIVGWMIHMLIEGAFKLAAKRKHN